MTKDTGGFAFPHDVIDSDKFKGMTLRDYFAAKAMQALVADRRHVTGMGLPNKSTQYAEGAYQIADAMLAERMK